MRRASHCIQPHKPFRVLLSVLLLWSSIQAQYCPVEGRWLSNFQRIVNPRQLPVAEEGRVLMERALIGSRPPRCEAIRCVACGRCEPVQVPVIPQMDSRKQAGTAIFRTDAYYGDYGSNYKPMKWSCKCGDRIFNP